MPNKELIIGSCNHCHNPNKIVKQVFIGFIEDKGPIDEQGEKVSDEQLLCFDCYVSLMEVIKEWKERKNIWKLN